MIDVLRILVAPLVWLASFSGIYGLHGIACAGDWTEVELLGLSLFRVALIGAWAVAILVQIALLLALRSDRFGSRSAFARRTSVITGWVGLVATLWSLQPVVTTSSCL